MRQAVVYQERAFALYGALLWRLRNGIFPFTPDKTVVPQMFIPERLRRDTRKLMLFYFFVCVYMRGSIQSITVFKQLIKMWEDFPELFEPACIVLMPEDILRAIITLYVGWDKENSPRIWKENAHQLLEEWEGDARNLIGGLASYEEALARIRNKRGKKHVRKHRGFKGFREKMVSLFLYFCDWEGLLQPRFIYPSAVDIHHLRLHLSTGILVVFGKRKKLKYTETLLAPVRETLVAYLRKTRCDPIELADALWLYSILMCGESPVTTTKFMPQYQRDKPGKIAEEDRPQRPLFKSDHLPRFDRLKWLQQPRVRSRILSVCGRCFVRKECKHAIPARPYYSKGDILFWDQPFNWNEMPEVTSVEYPVESFEHPEFVFSPDE